MPGKTYRLVLTGKNLLVTTKISFGRDLTIVGVPYVQSPTRAMLDVIVSPAATPGARAATATNPATPDIPAASSTGPGAVMVTVASRQAPKPTPSPGILKRKFKQRYGKILLDLPCDPDSKMSTAGKQPCAEPMTVTDQTLFVWHEQNPGIAEFFVFEIVDADGTVYLGVQTTKKYLKLSAANLATLPRLEKTYVFGSLPTARKEPKAGETTGPAAAIPAGGQVAPQSKPSSSMPLGYLAPLGKPPAPSELGVVKDIKPGDTAAMTAAAETAGKSGVDSGPLKAWLVSRPPVEGEAYWRVRGLAKRIDENTGQPTSEMIEVEDSAERAIQLPLPPNGFACDSGTKGSNLGTPTGKFWPVFFAEGKRPKPCPGNSTNVCSTADYAVLPSSARVNLTRVPFPIHQVGDAGSSEVTFQNVFVDWGDGTEPKPLRVKGSAAANLKAVKLIRPGVDDNSRLQHFYMNKNLEAEFVTYKIRIFSLADQDKTPPWKFSLASSSEAKPSSTLLESFAATADTLSAAQDKVAAEAGLSTGGASSGPATAVSTAPTASAAEAKVLVAELSPKTFTIACTEVQVWNPWGVGADEPLHLLTANILFPGDDAAFLGKAKPYVPMSPSGLDKAVPKPPAKAPGPMPTPPKSSSFGFVRASFQKEQAQPTVQAKPPPSPSVAVKPKPVDTHGPVPEISDCSSAFKAAVKLTYWGHGKIRLYWYLDGELIEQKDHPTELPPVSTADGEAGKKPKIIEMDSALPAVLQAEPHRLKVRVEGGSKTKPFAPGSVAAKLDPAAFGLGSTQYSGKDTGAPIVGPVTQAETKPASGLPAVQQVGLAPGGTPPGFGGVFSIIPLETQAPPTSVESPERSYKVVDHKVKGFPCTLLYTTAKTGTFEISDLSSFAKSGEGAAATYKGSGLLHLILPSTSDAVLLEPVPVSFDGWTLAPSAVGNEDVLDVKSGSLDMTMGVPVEAQPLNFPMGIARLKLDPQQLALDGTVGLNPDMGFTTDTELPAWEFAGTPVTSEGDFSYAKAKAGEAGLEASGFSLEITNAQVDFSRKEGTVPTSPCAAVPEAAPWMGILLDGKLKGPPAIQFGGVNLLADVPISDWGIVANGLNVKYENPSYTKSVAESAVKIKAKGFKFSSCGGSSTRSFGVEVENAPLVVQKIIGTLSVDDFAVVHPYFPGVNIDHDWGNVKAKITKAALTYDADIGNWNVTVDSHLKFYMPSGSFVYENDYNGVLVTLAGNIFGPDGETGWFPVEGGGTANIGGYPMQVTKLGLGNAPGKVFFGFLGDLKVGGEVPDVKDRESKFNLVIKTAALEPPQTGFVLASYSPASIADDFSYSSSETDGVQVGDVHVDFFFPPGSKTVQVVADCHWEKSPGGYRFTGLGKVSVAESFGIDVTVLFGSQSDESYWMVKAALSFPAPLALGSTGFGLFAIGGGLGYNISIASYDFPDVTTVVIDHSKNYSFSAAADLGSLDGGFTLYLRGRLTVKFGEGGGFRIDVDAWVLTGDHSGSGMAEACIQYVGGTFDAGFAANFQVAGGLLAFKAPKWGPDTCLQSAIQIHFGGSGWHIWIGHKDPGKRITAMILVVESSGWMMLDGSGISAGVETKVDKKYCVDFEICEACAWFHYDMLIEIWVNFSPFQAGGEFNWGVGGGVSVCGEGLSFDGSLHLTAQAPDPTQICGEVSITIHTPNWFPNVDVDFGVCVG